MGLQCKPVGKLGGLMAKTQNTRKKEDMAAKRAKSKDAGKENGKKSKSDSAKN